MCVTFAFSHVFRSCGRTAKGVDLLLIAAVIKNETWCGCSSGDSKQNLVGVVVSVLACFTFRDRASEEAHSKEKAR